MCAAAGSWRAAGTWDGKLEQKQHSFEDFVACARFLVDEAVTSPEMLVAMGASAGGLLVGASVNLAPELFAGILAGVPFVDCLTTMLDVDLPLTIDRAGGVGQPDRRRGRVLADEVLLALRQRAAGSLSENAGDRRPERPEGLLLRADEMGAEAPCVPPRQRGPGPAQDGDVLGAPRAVRAVPGVARLGL